MKVLRIGTKTFSDKLAKNSKIIIILFIILSTVVFVLIGKPVKVMIIVGALNGLILPITLGTMIIAAHKKSIVGEYKHPIWMTIFGILVVIVMAYLGIDALIKEIPKLLI